MKCAQCSADNRSGAKFCEQCGARIVAGVAQDSVNSGLARDSLVDEVVASMAKEPGTTKGPGFKLAMVFLFLILIAGVWWAFKGDAARSPAPAGSADKTISGMPASAPSKAPSLAEQMGTTAASVQPPVSTVKTEQSASAGKAATDGKRARDVKTKSQREDEQARKNEEMRLERQAREAAAKKASASSSRALSTAQEVAICEKMSVFARQPCLWRACNNKWGKEGCPSYD